MLGEGAHLEGVSCSRHDVVPLAFRLTDDREEERHVRRIVQIDPDLCSGRCGHRAEVSETKGCGVAPLSRLPLADARLRGHGGSPVTPPPARRSSAHPFKPLSRCGPGVRPGPEAANGRAHPLLLLLCNAREHRQRKNFACHELGHRKIAPSISQTAIALLQVQRHRVVQSGPDPLLLQVCGERIAFCIAHDIKVIHAATGRWLVRQPHVTRPQVACRTDSRQGAAACSTHRDAAA